MLDIMLPHALLIAVVLGEFSIRIFPEKGWPTTPIIYLCHKSARVREWSKSYQQRDL